MKRHLLRVLLLFGLVAAVGCVLRPQWLIEHPHDPTLIIGAERHWVWNAPVHAHLDASSTLLPVLIIAALCVVARIFISDQDVPEQKSSPSWPSGGSVAQSEDTEPVKKSAGSGAGLQRRTIEERVASRF